MTEQYSIIPSIKDKHNESKPIETGDIVNIYAMTASSEAFTWRNCIVMACPYPCQNEVRFWIVKNELGRLLYFEPTTVMVELKAKDIA